VHTLGMGARRAPLRGEWGIRRIGRNPGIGDEQAMALHIFPVQYIPIFWIYHGFHRLRPYKSATPVNQ